MPRKISSNVTLTFSVHRRVNKNKYKPVLDEIFTGVLMSSKCRRRDLFKAETITCSSADSCSCSASTCLCSWVYDPKSRKILFRCSRKLFYTEALIHLLPYNINFRKLFIIVTVCKEGKMKLYPVVSRVVKTTCDVVAHVSCRKSYQSNYIDLTSANAALAETYALSSVECLNDNIIEITACCANCSDSTQNIKDEINPYKPPSNPNTAIDKIQRQLATSKLLSKYAYFIYSKIPMIQRTVSGHDQEVFEQCDAQVIDDFVASKLREDNTYFKEVLKRNISRHKRRKLHL